MNSLDLLNVNVYLPQESPFSVDGPVTEDAGVEVGLATPGFPESFVVVRCNKGVPFDTER